MSDHYHRFDQYFRALSDTIRAKRGYIEHTLRTTPQKQEPKRLYDDERGEYEESR